MRIKDGEVLVNEEVEIKRGKKLIEGDRVGIEGKTYEVKLD